MSILLLLIGILVSLIGLFLVGFAIPIHEFSLGNTLMIAGATATGNLFGIVQSCAPPDEVGVWTGFENFAGNIGGVIAPAATGLLIARTGSYVPGFALAVLVLLTGLLAYWLVVGKLKPTNLE